MTQIKTKQPPKQQTTLQAEIIRRIYRNSENGYTVLACYNDENGDFKATGSLPSVREGDEYRFKGQWKNHPKFGEQFQFTEAELVLPSSKSGIARYLSQVTYGVGVAKAQKIAEALGEDALTKIKEDPSVLENLEFLNEQQRQDIAADLAANDVQAELASLVCAEGIGMGTVAKLMQQYGNDAVSQIKENPYVLIDDVFGVGFSLADRIALQTGIKPDSRFRVEAAMRYALEEAANEGHVYLHPNDIFRRLVGGKTKTQKAGIISDSGVGVGEIKQAFQELERQEVCVREGDAIYLKKYYETEKSLAGCVRRLLAKERPDEATETVNLKVIEMWIGELQRKWGIEYATEQRRAIIKSLMEPVSIITGGPGCGKSEITRAIVDIYKKMNSPREGLYLCAPTGRAAKRLSEATGVEAKTIHRLLRYNPGVGGFEFGHSQPLPGPGLIIVDEASMMDLELAEALFAATSANPGEAHQVVLIGDINQLPSVGAGNVLRDLINSDAVPFARLLFNYRQAGGSKVAEYANLICDGRLPELRSNGDFHYITVESADDAVEWIEYLAQTGAVGMGLPPLQWQVLAPMKRGNCGVNALNEKIKELLNPKDEQELQLGSFSVGDKVMVIKNDYSLGVFNGDLGVVKHIERGKMVVDFGELSTVEFSVDNLGILVPAWASTIHKSQGSEFDVVIMPLVSQHYMMLQRNLLYTGMTRARKELILIADEKSLKRAVENNRVEKRLTGLQERLRGGGGE